MTTISGSQIEKTRVLGPAPELSASASGDSLLDRLPRKPQERYHFIRSIGFGGMKGVLLVRDRDTDREVAMAIMPDFRDRPRQDLERFVSEALLTARLEHPNIVPVHDIGVDSSGSPFFTMKYLRGQSLAQLIMRLRDGDPPMVEKYTIYRRLQIFLRVCNAVDFAHSRRCCHLDIKPANVNIGDFGEVVVLDWGLASPLDDKGIALLAGDRRAKGTPGYMPPEFLSPETANMVGVASDIYLLGGVLYALLSLSSPLANRDQEEKLRCTAAGEIPPPSQVAPVGWHVPASLEAVCLKAMAHRPVDRYRNVTELRQEIIAFMSGYAPQAEHASPLRRTALFLMRNRLALVIILLVLTVALLLSLRVAR